MTRLLVTPGLPRDAWLLQAGVVLNFFGNGLVAPYLVIYLHFDRGIPLSLAALAIGSGGILATISGLVVGPLVDRFGPRTCGRYLAVTGFAWQAGFMIGPSTFGALASVQLLIFPLAAAATCGLLALALWRVGRNRWDPSD